MFLHYNFTDITTLPLACEQRFIGLYNVRALFAVLTHFVLSVSNGVQFVCVSVILKRTAYRVGYRVGKCFCVFHCRLITSHDACPVIPRSAVHLLLLPLLWTGLRRSICSIAVTPRKGPTPRAIAKGVPEDLGRNRMYC